MEISRDLYGFPCRSYSKVAAATAPTMPDTTEKSYANRSEVYVSNYYYCLCDDAYCIYIKVLVYLDRYHVYNSI